MGARLRSEEHPEALKSDHKRSDDSAEAGRVERRGEWRGGSTEARAARSHQKQSGLTEAIRGDLKPEGVEEDEESEADEQERGRGRLCLQRCRRAEQRNGGERGACEQQRPPPEQSEAVRKKQKHTEAHGGNLPPASSSGLRPSWSTSRIAISTPKSLVAPTAAESSVASLLCVNERVGEVSCE